MTLNDWIVLALFGALLLTASLHLLAASGHFPKEARTPEIGTGAGPFILHGTILLVLLAVAAGVVLAFLALPWYAAVIGGGIAALVAPLMLPNFSDEFVDGRRGLVVFAALAYVALGCMWLLR